jgi:hypothetical protein
MSHTSPSGTPFQIRDVPHVAERYALLRSGADRPTISAARVHGLAVDVPGAPLQDLVDVGRGRVLDVHRVEDVALALAVVIDGLVSRQERTARVRPAPVLPDDLGAELLVPEHLIEQRARQMRRAAVAVKE